MPHESDDMTRDPQTPAYAAGWVVPSTEVPLDAMQVGPPTSADWPMAGPEFGTRPETVSRGAASEEPDTLASGGFDITGPVADEKPAAIIASALLNAPQQEGLNYLLNYANKSIRRNRGVAEQDRDDLLHEIYMEWWVCTGFEVAALPRLLESESPEKAFAARVDLPRLRPIPISPDRSACSEELDVSSPRPGDDRRQPRLRDGPGRLAGRSCRS